MMKRAVYAQDFPLENEAEFAKGIHELAGQMYADRQGRALEGAIEFNLELILRHRKGDAAVSVQQAQRASSEIGRLQRTSALIWEQCRAEAIEMLGLRHRDTRAESPKRQEAPGPAAVTPPEPGNDAPASPAVEDSGEAHVSDRPEAVDVELDVAVTPELEPAGAA